MNQPPSFVAHLDDIPEVEQCYPPPFDREKLTFARNIGEVLRTTHFGISVERLPPHRRTSFTHAHSSEEEIILVLAGACHLRTIESGAAAREAPLRTGSVVLFTPNTRIAHTFVNRGSEDCLLLIVGERLSHDRVFYPEDPDYDRHLAATRPERYWTEGR